MSVAVKIHFPQYDRESDQYYIHYEIREGSKTIDSGRLSEPYTQLRQAQTESDRLNGCGA